MEPPVCEPIAATHMPHASAAAEPLLEPPGVRSRFHGLRVTGGSKLANAVVTVLPRKIAPARLNRSTVVASRRAILCAHSRDPHEYENLALDTRVKQTADSLRQLLKDGWQAALPSK